MVTKVVIVSSVKADDERNKNRNSDSRKKHDVQQKFCKDNKFIFHNESFLNARVIVI